MSGTTSHRDAVEAATEAWIATGSVEAAHAAYSFVMNDAIAHGTFNDDDPRMNRLAQVLRDHDALEIEYDLKVADGISWLHRLSILNQLLSYNHEMREILKELGMTP